MSVSQTNALAVALVVDDEALLRMYASDLLEEEGFAVMAAADADAALKILETLGQMYGSCSPIFKCLAVAME
jgi:CheY-like chemotaxis protein